MSGTGSASDFVVVNFSPSRHGRWSYDHERTTFSRMVERSIQRTLDTYLVDEDSRPDPLETTFLLAAIHYCARGFSGEGARRTGPWTLFQNLQMLADFQLVRRRFSSLLYGTLPLFGPTFAEASGADRVQLPDNVRLIEDLMQDVGLKPRVLDSEALLKEARDRLDDHLARPDSDVADSVEGGNPESEPSSSADRWGHLARELAIPVVGHLFQAQRNKVAIPIDGWQPIVEETVARVFQVDPVHGAQLQRWSTLLETSLADARKIRPYPFFAIREIAGYQVMLVATPLLAEFVDEKVVPDQRIANFTVGVFGGTPSMGASGATTDEIASLLRTAMGYVNQTVSSHRHQQALQRSAGEATTISRFWFGEGLVQFLGQGDSSKQGLLSSEDPLDFWQRFIQQLLCARIDGVDDTEVFPFDRAFILDWTGATDKTGNLRIRVLEAGLRSRNPKDRNAYLTSQERRKKKTPLSQLSVTEKSIEQVLDFVVKIGESGLEMTGVGPLAGAREPMDYHLTGDVDDEGSADAERLLDLKISTILNYYSNAQELDKEEREQIQGRIWRFFGELGIAFDYQHGLDLVRDVPSLYALQDAYLRVAANLAKERTKEKDAVPVEGSETASPQDDGGLSTQAKVVYFAFDPEMIRDESQKSLLAGEQCVILLVADDDQEKGVAELNAERADLNLLVEMVVRQRLRARAREEEVLRDRVDLLKESLEMFVHRIKDQNKAEAAALKEALAPILQKHGSMESLEFSGNSLEILGMLLPTESEVDALTPTHGLDGGSSPGCSDPSQSLLTHRSPESRLRRVLEERIKKPVTNVRFLESVLPPIRMRVPLGIVRECFKVLLHNAVEAATQAGAPETPEIRVQIQARSAPERRAGRSASGTLDGGQKWFLEIVVENTSPPVSDALLAKLNAANPIALDKNKDKVTSSGLGVATSRKQLRLSLGEEASISFVRADSFRIQARMTLPATVRAVEGISTPAKVSAEVATRHWVLYVEDERELAAGTLRHLAQWFPSTEWTVVHRRGDIEALKDVRARIPDLVVMDMKIVHQEEEEDHTAHQKNGLSLLEGLMDQFRSSHRPPIWLVSHDTLSDIRQNIRGIKNLVDGAGYREVSHQTKDLTQPGTLVLLAGLKPVEEHAFLKDELTLFAASKQVEVQADRLVTTDSSSVATGYSCRVFEAEFDGPDFAKRLDEWSGVPRQGIAQGIFVVRAQGSGRKDLLAVVQRWMHHPGVPVADAITGSGAARRLADSLWHQNIVLELVTHPRVLAGLPCGLVYWMLRHNIWLTTRRFPDPTELAGRWDRMNRVPAGIFSSMRHDIKNSFSGRDVPGHVKSLIERINQVEAMVRTADLDLRFTDILEDTDTAQVEEQIKELARQEGSCPPLSTDRQPVLQALSELGAPLKQFIALLPDAKKNQWTLLLESLESLKCLLGNKGDA